MLTRSLKTTCYCRSSLLGVLFRSASPQVHHDGLGEFGRMFHFGTDHGVSGEASQEDHQEEEPFQAPSLSGRFWRNV